MSEQIFKKNEQTEPIVLKDWIPVKAGVKLNNLLNLKFYVMKKLDLNAFGVEKMNTIEICSIEGGSFFDYYIGAFQYFIDNFNTNALLIMNDQNGTAIDGYMGSKL